MPGARQDACPALAGGEGAEAGAGADLKVRPYKVRPYKVRPYITGSTPPGIVRIMRIG